jgi:hypothetical protein
MPPWQALFLPGTIFAVYILGLFGGLNFFKQKEQTLWLWMFCFLVGVQ